MITMFCDIRHFLASSLKKRKKKKTKHGRPTINEYEITRQNTFYLFLNKFIHRLRGRISQTRISFILKLVTFLC